MYMWNVMTGLHEGIKISFQGVWVQESSFASWGLLLIQRVAAELSQHLEAWWFMDGKLSLWQDYRQTASHKANHALMTGWRKKEEAIGVTSYQENTKACHYNKQALAWALQIKMPGLNLKKPHTFKYQVFSAVRKEINVTQGNAVCVLNWMIAGERGG